MYTANAQLSSHHWSRVRVHSHWYEYEFRVRVSVYGSYKLHPYEWAFMVICTHSYSTCVNVNGHHSNTQKLVFAGTRIQVPGLVLVSMWMHPNTEYSLNRIWFSCWPLFGITVRCLPTSSTLLLRWERSKWTVCQSAATHTHVTDKIRHVLSSVQVTSHHCSIHTVRRYATSCQINFINIHR